MDIDEICIKEDTIGNDFYYITIPYEKLYRDGTFNECQFFIIYSKKDIKKIIEMLQQCI